jgi:hypothetical protein
MKYVDNLVLVSKEQTVLQGMIDRVIEIGGCYGIKINVEETRARRISGEAPP